MARSGFPASQTAGGPVAFSSAASPAADFAESLSLPQMQATVVPASANPSMPFPVGVSSPPAWKMLAAKVARAVGRAIGPIVARYTRGRSAAASARSRSSSNASAARTRGNPSGGRGSLPSMRPGPHPPPGLPFGQFLGVVGYLTAPGARVGPMLQPLQPGAPGAG